MKRCLEALGFTVKGEVCGCDLVALHAEEPPIVVIGELIVRQRAFVRTIDTTTSSPVSSQNFAHASISARLFSSASSRR